MASVFTEEQRVVLVEAADADFQGAAQGVEKALKKAKYFEGDGEQTASSMAAALIASRTVMEYLWGLPKHIRSPQFVRGLVERAIMKWLKARDAVDDPEMEGIVSEVLKSFLPAARSDAMTIRKHVRFAGMR